MHLLQRHLDFRFFFRICAMSMILMYVSSCGLCANRVIFQVVSPNRSIKAVVFERDCGATTGPNIQVSVIPADSLLPDDKGNVFIEDHNRPLSTSQPIKISWKSDADLQITFNQNDNVFAENTTCSVMVGPLRWKTIRISYVKV